MSDEREPDRAGAVATSSRAESAPARPRRIRPVFAVRRGLGMLASLVKLVCWLIALLLVLYIIFVAGKANPANAWNIVVTDWAHRLNLGLGNLFTLPDPRVSVLVDYGIAAIIWLIIGGVVARVLRRF